MIRSIAGTIVTPTTVIENGWIGIDDRGKIADIGAANGHPTADLDMAGHLVVAGFVDMHVHGGGGADFMNGTTDAARQAARTHARHGTTGMLATTLTAFQPEIDRSISAAMAVADDRGGDEARILGVHLEGPYICAAKRGAQPLEPIRKSDIGELDHWIELSGGRIRQITMAPEIDGAPAFITAARSRGVTVSIGHTDATAAQTELGIAAGASQATHLFNAMRGLQHREPGTVGALLAADTVACELIVDGVHLSPTVVRIAVRAKGVDGCLLVTDAIEGADMPDGNYVLGATSAIIVKDGRATFADGTLAGSVLTMERAYANVREFAAITASEASHMSSLVPARQIGIADKKGSIEVGKDADIAIIDPSTGAIVATIVEGNMAYRR